MKPQLVVTADGSSSLFIPELDEHYHSTHGAIQESNHVFIDAGLNLFLNHKKPIHILEMGFGTGLNALLSCLNTTAENTLLYYTSIEKYPVQASLIQQLNYDDLIDNKTENKNIFQKIHQCEWESFQNITPYFYLKKCKIDAVDIEWKNTFDIIYFDAFAPSVQPELWTAFIFKKMYDALKEQGILVTYCAKGVVKRTMKEVGFLVETIPGPPGKREMTRATKQLI